MSNTSSSGAAEGGVAVASAWSPLRNPVFRAIWIAFVASNIGAWMQSVGAAWLMTDLTPSPLLVALMQAAISLPVFLVGLPAGALADIIDRRKLLLLTQGWMLLAALALGLLTLIGAVSAWSLLGLTFALGLGAALNGPAWQALVPDLVERRDLQAAVALEATGFNVARAVGPAIGGLVVAAAGPGAVFLLNAASFLAILWAIYRWRGARAASDTPPEDVFSATVAGLRYVRHAPALKAVLIRNGVFILGASALWALLPVVSRQELGLDATGYGIILGSLGLGGVAGSVILPRLRRRFNPDILTGAATVLFAAATLAAAYLRLLPLLVLFMVLGGMGWITMMASLNFAATTAAPGWVRARALGVYLLVFQGLMALGSFAWGAVAERFGYSVALAGAALLLVGGLLTLRRWPLRQVGRLDLNYSGHWGDPQVALKPQPQDGPVLVSIEYRVPAANTDAFLGVMEEMRRFRRREGAVRWDLFRDLDDPDRYVESFVVSSWGEHVRQHGRVTVDDQAIEARRDALLQPGVVPRTTHLISAHVMADQNLVAPASGEISLEL